MSDHDGWTSYSHWGMFFTGTKVRAAIKPRRSVISRRSN
jgi:hypothetical protein